jgi:uncharacterized repeat protein (TIGR01451 family)
MMSEPERPSRQSLVVPQRHAPLPVVLGALACGAVGFGLVWALGIGRPTADARAVSAQIQAPATAAEPPAAAAEPAPFPGADEAIRELPAAGRWQPRGSAAAEPPAAFDRYARPASLDVPDPVITVSGEERPLSRFSAPNVPHTPREPASEAEPAASPSTDPSATARAFAATDVEPPPTAAEPASVSSEESSGDALPPAGDRSPVQATEPLGVGEDAGDRAAEARAPATAPDPPPVSPFAAAPAAPLPPARLPPAIPDHPPGRPAVTDPPAVPRPTVRGVTGAVPYAAAPPMVPGAFGGGQQPARAAQGPVAIGQGRPGPMQLEGIQTPQLAVEKRGPREVQVGKPARYEILVRNVGSATAHDVTLRDAIPFGTTLVTTAPPASPVQTAAGAAGEGELVWSLGTLDPGGQVRVVMEVMPQEEGEIGSIASVSFRADASIRSRATKPALRIEATEPKPVLIGRDTQLTVTVSNPGSGVATGVVLEGFLPDNVSHRTGSELEFDVGQLRPGESRTIDLVLGTRGPGVQAARFIARADGGVEAEQKTKLEVTAPTLELAVDMPVRRFLQRPATCSIAMVNAGTAPARAVELAAQLPPGMKFVRANNAGWHDERTHRVLWNLEELPPGETGTVEVVVMPVALGPQKIMAAARSADGLADQVAHVCEVEGLAAVSFEVVDSEDPVEVGGVTEYVVRVGNQGTKPATGVRVTATLLGDLEPVEAQGPAGHRMENRAVVFDPLVKLAPSEEAVFRIRARGRRAGDQRVQVQVVSQDHAAPITKEEITRVYDDR